MIKYAKTFSTDSQNYLWHISTQKYKPDEEKKIKEKLKKLCPDITIHFNSLTFSDLVENLERVYESNKHDEGLKLLFEDFENYCNETDLMTDYQHKLIIVPTGRTFKWNLDNKIYFCPLNRHKQKFTYFGLYIDKVVETIATVENCIVADFDKATEQLTVHSSEVSEDQIKRLKDRLSDRGVSQSGLKYYLFNEGDFFETKFRKRSKRGMQGHRYIDLEDVIGSEQIKDMTTTEDISNCLRDKEWD